MDDDLPPGVSFEQFWAETTPPEDEASTKRRRTMRSRIFVIAGGASGKGFQPQLHAWLEEWGSVTEVERWVGTYASNMPKNVALLERVYVEAAETGKDVVLVGSSFGCRVVCAFLAKSSAVRGALLVSYPLYGPSSPRTPDDDRALSLWRLPPDTRLLFISGEKDEFLDRTKGGTAWRSLDAPTGVPALRSVLCRAPCAHNVTILPIQSTSHDVFRLYKRRRSVSPRKYAHGDADSTKPVTPSFRLLTRTFIYSSNHSPVRVSSLLLWSIVHRAHYQAHANTSYN